MNDRLVEHVSTEELFLRHAPYVARLLHRLGVSRHDLDDVVQEVFLVVHKNGGCELGTGKVTTYLGSVAIRAASSYRRRFRSLRERLSVDSQPADIPWAGASPLEAVETHRVLKQLHSAFEALAPELRAIYGAVEFEGRSCAAVAEELAMPIGTVYWHLHLARKSMREAIGRSLGRIL